MYGIILDRDSPRTLAAQLTAALRSAIHDGRVAGGETLLSSRKLAEELGLSRRLVAEVYDQLVSEGYLRAREGSGTCVLEGLAIKRPAVSAAKRHTEVRQTAIKWDFTAGIPDLRAFPRKAWLRAFDQSLSFATQREMSYGPAAGDGRLREALAGYLYRQRGMAVDPDCLVLSAGTAGSLNLLIRLGIFGEVWFEEPGLGYARNHFVRAGLCLRDLVLDDQGADPAACRDMAERSLVYLTPSHQFPTGALMPVQRRAQFLDLAARTGSYIIEDDYDSEFRLRSAPVPPIQHLGPERVIYLGSFSKILAPFLRVSYLILPPALVDPVLEQCRGLNIRGSVPIQRALAILIEIGDLERHVHRQKKQYVRRLEIIEEFIARRWPDGLAWNGNATGSHLKLRFARRRFDGEFFADCAASGLRLTAMDEFYASGCPEGQGDLLMGYGNISAADLPEGLDRLARLIDRPRQRL